MLVWPWEVVNVALPGLEEYDSAKLFLQRMHRPPRAGSVYGARLGGVVRDCTRMILSERTLRHKSELM